MVGLLFNKAYNNGFNPFLKLESSMIVNDRQLMVTASKQAALRRGKSIFTRAVLKSR